MIRTLLIVGAMDAFYRVALRAPLRRKLGITS
jgi:hypothetical protein